MESFRCSVATSCTLVTVPHSFPLKSSLPVSPSVEEMRTFYNEVAILKRLSRRGNPHVITMVGYIARENPPAIVMEFAPLGSLHDFLVKIKEEVRSCMSNKCLYTCVLHSVLLWSSHAACCCTAPSCSSHASTHPSLQRAEGLLRQPHSGAKGRPLICLPNCLWDGKQREHICNCCSMSFYHSLSTSSGVSSWNGCCPP